MSKKNCCGIAAVEDKRKMADEMKSKTGLAIALEAVGLSKSSYYYKSEKNDNKHSKEYPLDEKLRSILLSLSGYELTLGYRKTMDYIDFVLNKGHYNHKKVYRHMDILEMLQPKRIKKQSKPKKELSFYSPFMSNVRWEADLSYVFYGCGTAHAFVVIDSYDKEVIGRYFSMRARAEEAVIALDRAVSCRFGDSVPDSFEVILRVDRGCQYTAEDFCEAVEKRKWLRIEFCGVQAPNDKPYIESWFACYKREEVYRNDYRNFWEAITGFEAYIDWYNNRRPHGSLGNISPINFRTGKQRVEKEVTMISGLPETEEVSTFSVLIMSRN
jgi:putative transposase